MSQQSSGSLVGKSSGCSSTRCHDWVGLNSMMSMAGGWFF
jgi:hypothetical protein